MTTNEALKIVLELAEQSIIKDEEIAWHQPVKRTVQEIQIKAVAIVRVAFRVM